MTHKIEYSDNRSQKTGITVQKYFKDIFFKQIYVLGFLKFEESFLEIPRSPWRKEAFVKLNVLNP